MIDVVVVAVVTHSVIVLCGYIFQCFVSNIEHVGRLYSLDQWSFTLLFSFTFQLGGHKFLRFYSLSLNDFIIKTI